MSEEIDKDLVERIDPILKQMYGNKVKVTRTECVDASMEWMDYEIDIMYKDRKGNQSKTIEVRTSPVFGGLVCMVDGQPTEQFKRKADDLADYGEMMADAFGSDGEEGK